MAFASEDLDFSELEVRAKANAMKQICTMLQRPDQLDNIEQYKKKILRRKATTDALLKDALQSQLDGVQSGLNNLRETMEELDLVKDSLERAKGNCATLDKNQPILEELCVASLDHKANQIAKDNLEHIFTVPERVNKCTEYIEEGKYLLAHKHLMELENSRDELLYELHRQPQQSKTNMLTVKTYFKGVGPLNAKLEKKLFDIFKRRITAVILEPKELVTVVRIIEREEQIDDYWESTFMKSGFLPEGRRKKWRQRAFETMENQCRSYIEVFLSQPDQSGTDATWLVHQLELAKTQIMGDLKVAKTILPSCCPPSYNIFNAFSKWYASSLSASFRQITKRKLQNTEIVPLLSWLKAYKSEEMMGHPDFKMEEDDIADLLEPAEIKSLVETYETNIQSKLGDWMNNSLSTEKADLNSGKRPESDGNQQYFTSLPIILHDMIEENMKLAVSVSQDLTLGVFRISIEQLSSFLDSYKSAFQTYKLRHFGNRQEFMPYTVFTIAMINNLGLILSNMNGTMSRYGEDCILKTGKTFLNSMMQSLSGKLETLTRETISDLLDEMFMDLEGPFSRVMTRPWINSSESIDTICVTIEDYTQDYVHLQPKFYDALVSMSRQRAITNYLRRLLSRSISFVNHEERLELANQITKENESIRSLYDKMGAAKTQADDEMADAIPFVAEILRLTDPSMMSLELATLLNNFPDVTKEHLMAILYLRSDVKGSASEIISECLEDEEERRQKTRDLPPTVFSKIKIESKLF